MFKFENYPELIPYHEKYQKLRKQWYKINETDDEKNNAMEQKIEKLKVEYQEVICNILKLEKPSIYDYQYKKYYNWNKILKTNSDNYEDVKIPKEFFINLVEEGGGGCSLSPK